MMAETVESLKAQLDALSTRLYGQQPVPQGPTTMRLVNPYRKLEKFTVKDCSETEDWTEDAETILKFVQAEERLNCLLTHLDSIAR